MLDGGSGEETRAFGSVIFAAAGSDIETLGDIKGKSVLAVDAAAFGGFQVGWHEFDKQGVDLFNDAASLAFTGFPPDQIVMRVLNGEADAGIVRSGLLEAMSREGHIDLSDVTILNPNAEFGHPEQLSTRLYPEWPFLALGGTDPTLRNAVARALLDTWAFSVRAQPGLPDSWEAPVSYHAVRALLVDYADARRQETPMPVWQIFPFAAFTGLMLAIVFLVLRRRHPLVEQQPADAQEPETETSEQEDRPPLTRREIEILAEICDGHSTKEIAKVLGISPKTVEFHRSNLLRKYCVSSSLQLVKVTSEP